MSGEQNSKLEVVFEGGLATINYISNGRKKNKTVQADALCKPILAGSESAKEVRFNPPGLRITAKSGDRLIIGYEFPERVAKIPFNEGGDAIELNSVWPWGITFIEFSDTPEGLKWNTFYQFGLKGPISTMDTMLYMWPGSNVFEDHRCCIGSIKVPKLAGIEQTGGLPFIFYNGVSNRDLSDNRFKRFTPQGETKAIVKPLDLYRHLSVKDGAQPKPFPYDIMENAFTLKSFLTERRYM